MANLMKATACVLVAGTSVGIEPASNLLWNEFETPRLLESGEMVQDAYADPVEKDDDDQGLMATLQKEWPPLGFGSASTAAFLVWLWMVIKHFKSEAMTEGTDDDAKTKWGELAKQAFTDLSKIGAFGLVWAIAYMVLKAFLPLKIPLVIGLISMLVPLVGVLGIKGWKLGGMQAFKDEFELWDPSKSAHSALVHFLGIFVVLLAGEGLLTKFVLGDKESDDDKPQDEPVEPEDEDDDE